MKFQSQDSSVFVSRLRMWMCLCACPCAVSFSLFANFIPTASNLSWMVNARCFLNDMLAPRWQDAGLNLLITLAVLLKVTLLVNHSRPCLIHSMCQLVEIWQREPHSTKLYWLSPSEECLGNPWGLKGNFSRVFWPGVFGENVLDYILGFLYLNAFNFLKLWTPLKIYWTLENLLQEIHAKLK